MFITKGYSATTLKMIADELDTSSGHISFYFPSKEDLLAILTNMLCEFQWKLIKDSVEDGKNSLTAVCFELMSMASACEDDEVAKDFFVSAYQSPVCLSIIHKNDSERAKEVFAEFCSGWTDEQFSEAEILVSGIEHSTLNTIDRTVSLETRISGALNAIMMIYGVPEEIRKKNIGNFLAMDYLSIGKRIFKEFREYVEQKKEVV